MDPDSRKATICGSIFETTRILRNPHSIFGSRLAPNTFFQRRQDPQTKARVFSRTGSHRFRFGIWFGYCRGAIGSHPKTLNRDVGFSIDSRMFVHAVYTVSCLSTVTLTRKLELFRSFGFSKEECIEMFRRAPGLLRTSEVKLKLGIEFFMKYIKFEKSVLVHRPSCLMHSMEKRVIPRYRVLQLIKVKRLLKKEPSFISVLILPEDEFLEKFISRFRDNAEELLVTYRGDILDSSEE
ncbi:hypothetical protein F0562_003314 [Nyssa sinensis]|uniref:Uncharacterized protein n=1 Tax=Nyssa sinensis TaxID=561372 RepID=A0A5J5BV23_9ASTE|nr:hypothetical protein F0562_003314 [Nyssa sinensis]